MRRIKQFTLESWKNKVAAANGLQDKDLKRQQDTGKRKRKEKGRSEESGTVKHDSGAEANA